MPASSNTGYCRKEKSLGLLCSNFLRLYNRDGVRSISLDDTANRLGVERRRIYDIVNVLESVGILRKKGKNQYSWRGFSGLPKALQKLKEEDSKEDSSTVDANLHSKMSDDGDDNEESSDLTTESHKSIPVMYRSTASVRSDNRREKSLVLLTRNFVKLFVCSKKLSTQSDLISLDEAAGLLLGNAQSISLKRTKVRRLYDIANVLASIHLIEKTHTSVTRKPAFRWLGLGDEAKNRRACNAIPLDSNKRTFGTDATIINLKANKSAKSFDLNKSPETDCSVEADGGKFEGNQNSKRFSFGPFSPIATAEVKASENGETKWVRDQESLTSTFHPPYRNPALRELFSHFMESWRLCKARDAHVLAVPPCCVNSRGPEIIVWYGAQNDCIHN